ncbi:MAG: hypothetical protein ACLTXL_16525 [Clostridia bacterium]
MLSGGVYGVLHQNLDGYCGYAGTARRAYRRALHVDICPEGEMWECLPYGGMILNNRIYGRGSLDNKGPLWYPLRAEAVKDSGKKLNKNSSDCGDG